MALLALRDLRTTWRLTLEDLAADTNISVSQLSRYESGERDPKLDHLERIARKFDTTVAALIGEDASVRVPLISWVSAGRMAPTEPVLKSQILKTISVPELSKGDWIALEVDGDSMDRVAPDGSIICVNRSDQRLVQDRFYVFSYDSGESTFKRYRYDPVRLQPYSTNPNHETIYPDGDLKVIGRVRRVIIDLD